MNSHSLLNTGMSSDYQNRDMFKADALQRKTMERKTFLI